MTSPHVTQERRRAARWKALTATLPEEARAPGRYVGKDGRAEGPPLPFCLPAEHAHLNLLPEVRQDVLQLFAELEVPWHASVCGGPSNHLLSSQVQCANALGQMVHDPQHLLRAFGAELSMADVLEIEPGRFLTFEFIGDEDLLGEGAGSRRTRGARCTSVDAAFRYVTTDGLVELALVEWKLTESYLAVRAPEPDRDQVRRDRYEHLLPDDGPLHLDRLTFEDLLDEPLYQLMRQQLLAHQLEKRRALEADVVRVVHVCPPANTDYQQSLVRESTRALGSTVDEVWARLLRQPDRFRKLDPAVFLDPDVTSEEYVLRYGGCHGADATPPHRSSGSVGPIR